jgi:hypothetical protein
MVRAAEEDAAGLLNGGTAALGGPKWRTHYDNKDGWRRLIESDEKFLSEIENELSGLNWWKNKLVGTLDVYEGIKKNTQDRLMQARESLAMDMIDDIDELKPEVWAKLSIEQKEDVIQQVHEAYAEAYGVQPITFEVDDINSTPGNEGRQGYMEPDGQKIVLDDDSFNSDDPRKALNTVVHESRHVLQKRATEDAGIFDYVPEETRDTWRENFKNYKSYPKYSYDEYKTQPVEDDAFDKGDEAEDYLYE